MGQKDHYKERIVNIDFFTNNLLQELPYPNVYSLVLLTSGTFYGVMNGIPLQCKAPCLLCLNDQDQLIITKEKNVTASTICFDVDFLRTLRISDQKHLMSTKSSIKNGMTLFERNLPFTKGFHVLTKEVYPKILDCFLIAGSEILIQSDKFWVCRIKEKLITLLMMVFEMEKGNELTPLNKALNYIHTNYSEKITLLDLIKESNLNRDSLNKEFKKSYKCTAMQYLLLYRIKIAKNFLTHTGLSLNEIAYATGFSYDTYFIKQFEKIEHQSPTAFRKLSRKIASYQ